MSKPFSQACENNKAPILEIIRDYFQADITVLEIGSYTAQHISYFARHLPTVTWLPSDTPASLAIVEAGLTGVNLANILAPVELDVCQERWPTDEVGGVFSANTLHIMSADSMPAFFIGAGKILQPGGYLCVYGPFKYDGAFTSDSNARFEAWLQEQNPLSGIRDFERVNALARESAMTLVADHAMLANNQLLVWQKTGSE